ncbi:MAG: cobyrinate a,c-diamide synthase [Terracidiphilus sp.]
MVTGTESGAGKTTVALALMAALRQRGYTVQPFKCGPDFLDTGHHSALCGRASRNLDGWMLGGEANRALFARAIRGADAAVVEGAMGLYDGASGETEEGSPAEMAKLLDLPVVLVVDAARSARSIAAVVKGFESFDPALRFAGIVLNRVAGDGHYRLLAAALCLTTATPLLGYLPLIPAIAIPERHLGLRTAEETASVENWRAAFTAAGREHLDLTPLLGLNWPGASLRSEPSCASCAAQPPVRIGVARDRAFSFYYEDNLDLLRSEGAEIVPFSPIDDVELPPALDALYLGGGYPELYADALGRNAGMLSAIRAFAGQDRPIYAECGGMIYLSRSLMLLDGSVHPLAGVLPLEFEMTPRLVNFGYVRMAIAADCLLGSRGTEARGHSFHCSRLRRTEAHQPAYRLAYLLSGREEMEGFCQKNLLASYVHLHFGANPAFAASLVGAARAARTAEALA